jgi:hypothetical protein
MRGLLFVTESHMRRHASSARPEGCTRSTSVLSHGFVFAFVFPGASRCNGLGSARSQVIMRALTLKRGVPRVAAPARALPDQVH